jgi:hypothetical protein
MIIFKPPVREEIAIFSASVPFAIIYYQQEVNRSALREKASAAAASKG